MHCYLHCISFSIHKESRLTMNWQNKVTFHFVSFRFVQSALQFCVCRFIHSFYFNWICHFRRKTAYTNERFCQQIQAHACLQRKFVLLNRINSNNRNWDIIALWHLCVCVGSNCVEAKTFKSTFVLQQCHAHAYTPFTYSVQCTQHKITTLFISKIW